jgi:small subunit ribosomal protein S16
MLRIRLRRTGAKKKPSYRVVVADARAPRDGTFIEILGHYNPLTDPSTFVVDAQRAQHWLARGAQPSDRVARLFKREGIDAQWTAPPADEPTPTVEAPAARRRTATKAPDGEAAPVETAAAGEEAPARARGRRAAAAGPEPTAEATSSAESEASAPAEESPAEPASQERAPRARRAAHAEETTETS